MSRNGHTDTNNNEPAETKLEAGNETEADSSSMSVVPDGGWGWIVVLGTFMIHVIAHGILLSFGVFVEDFVDYFECSKSAVGGVGSLMLGAVWGSGNVNSPYRRF